MNDTPLPEAASLRQALMELGFRPAVLDYATMTIHCPPEGIDPAHALTLAPGFERNGYFYTRAAAERAAREWA